jgi:aryl-alcohol dehydrogenase-like predicted oxidoreductase
MEYVELGRTRLWVSRLAMGTLTIGPLQARLSVGSGAALIRHGLELGINLIDTAQLYRTYDPIREALKGWTRPVVISTKSYAYTREDMADALEEARKGLDRDVIELFMLHEQESMLTFEGHGRAFEYLCQAKAKGWIKAVGVSTHSAVLARDLAEIREADVIHPILNFRGLGLLDGTREDMERALERAYAAGKGIFGMKPLGGGNLLDHAGEALAYAFDFPWAHSIAVGFRSMDELDFNVAALEKRVPPEKAVQRIQKTPRRLIIEAHCTGCGQCAAACPGRLLAVVEGRARLMGDGCVCCGYCGARCPQLAIKII